MKRDALLGIVLVILVVAVPGVAVPGALAESRHSGTITSVDAVNHTFTIDEMGPWSAGRNSIRRLTVEIDRETTVDRVERATGQEIGNAGWPGGYKEQPTVLTDVKAGEEATITGDERDGRFVARHVTIVVPDQDVMASPATELPQPVTK